MASLSRLWLVGGILVFVSGLGGSGRISVLRRMFGSGLMLFLPFSLPSSQGSSGWVFSYFG